MRTNMTCEGCGGHDVCGCPKREVKIRARAAINVALPRYYQPHEHYHMCAIHRTVVSCDDVKCPYASDLNVTCESCKANEPVPAGLEGIALADPLDLARIWFAKEVMC